MSSLAWIDFDEADRRRTQHIMALFQEREPLDELGLGGIRDSIADHLFPGISTIQTRLRYMLFVPWLFQMLENSTVGPDRLAGEARVLENGLTNALKAGGESNGIIGRYAGADLRRLPSSVYWAGLGAWGIRLFPGSIDSLFASMRRLPRSQPRGRKSEDAASENRAFRIWASTLPTCPKDILETVRFDLTTDEAQFIVDRLITKQPRSLLAFLARRGGEAADCDNIWEHPHIADFPDDARMLVEHGKMFSGVMFGASLVYNLRLSELRKNPEWIEKYRSLLDDWRAGLDMPAVRGWSLDDFWGKIDHREHRIRHAAKCFVAEWLDLVRTGDVSGGRLACASRMVQERERRLKTSQSRFVNRTVLDRWSGASGVEPFSFRWAHAGSHLRDIANAE